MRAAVASVVSLDEQLVLGANVLLCDGQVRRRGRYDAEDDDDPEP
jgi:prepilin-type processing-associated H-X9-DG protein